MITAKTSSYSGNDKYDNKVYYERQVDFDIVNIFQALQGRIRFGTGTNKKDGENIAGRFIQYTSNGSADTEDTIVHDIGSIPVGYLVIWQDKAGSFYQGPITGTDWTKNNIYLKCSATSVTALLFILK